MVGANRTWAMRTLTAVSVLAVGLAGCAQILGLNEPTDGGTPDSATGSDAPGHSSGTGSGVKPGSGSGSKGGSGSGSNPGSGSGSNPGSGTGTSSGSGSGSDGGMGTGTGTGTSSGSGSGSDGGMGSGTGSGTGVACGDAGCGDASAADAFTPTDGSAFVTISAALPNYSDNWGLHACALLQDGRVACWGNNKYNQMGGAFDGGTAYSPYFIPGVTGATQVVATSNGACALVTGGEVLCWGNYTSLASCTSNCPGPEPIPSLDGGPTLKGVTEIAGAEMNVYFRGVRSRLPGHSEGRSAVPKVAPCLARLLLFAVLVGCTHGIDAEHARLRDDVARSSTPRYAR
jgi:Regulator of chromosome condensation (RCC1) repeat